MNGFAILTPENDGDALLIFHFGAQSLPTVMDPLGLELATARSAPDGMRLR